MPRTRPALNVIHLEVAAFLAIIAVSWSDELFHLSRSVFGGGASSNWQEAAFETLVTVAVAIPTILLTRRFLDRLHRLEAFLRICAWCHRIGEKDRWVSLEAFFEGRFDTRTTHGICPDCAEKLRREA